MELAKGRGFKMNYVNFAAKIYFQFKDFDVPFITLQSIGLKCFAKVMKGSCVFYCSSCISFNPTSHLKDKKLRLFLSSNTAEHTHTHTHIHTHTHTK